MKLNKFLFKDDFQRLFDYFNEKYSKDDVKASNTVYIQFSNFDTRQFFNHFKSKVFQEKEIIE